MENVIDIPSTRRQELSQHGFTIAEPLDTLIHGKGRACSDAWLRQADDKRFERFLHDPPSDPPKIFVSTTPGSLTAPEIADTLRWPGAEKIVD